MPVAWADGVTPVNAANLETMEADTAAAAAAAAAAGAAGSPAAKLTPGGLGALLFTGTGPAPAWSDPLKFKTDANGKLGWGDGVTVDTYLYRVAAGILQVDNQFQVAGHMLIDTLNGGARLWFGSAYDTSLKRASADYLRTDGRFQVGKALMVDLDGAGHALSFGAAADTNLFRIGANALKTDGTFLADAEIIARDGNAALRSSLGWVPGGGGSAGVSLGGDTSLYRGGAGLLKTDGEFRAGGSIYAANGAAGQIILGADGKVYFGTAGDTNLYRAAAGKLRTDGTLDANALTVNGVPVGGGGVDYIGNWGAGTAYKQGDVVRYNGIDYLAVNPSTGQTPPASTPMVGGIGTALPASPIDGQAFTLVDSLTAPTYAWQFRYVAGITDAYKWVFIGGAPQRVFVLTSEQQNNITSPADLTTIVGITIARAGIYVLDHGAALYDSVNDFFAQATLKIGAAAADQSLSCFMRGRAGDWMSVAVGGLTKTVAAGDLVKQQYWASSSPSLLQAQQRWIEAVPVRVA